MVKRERARHIVLGEKATEAEAFIKELSASMIEKGCNFSCIRPYMGTEGQRNGSVYRPEVYNRKRSAKTLYLKNSYKKVDDSETVLNYSFDMENDTLSITVDMLDNPYGDFVDMVAAKWEEKYGQDKVTIFSDF